MGYRIDNVAVQISINNEFEGNRVLTFSFAPDKKFDFDLDPLVQALLDKNDEILKARMLAAGPADPTLLL